ncbi:isocitrate/isopropylmalate dehydrogenase family protein [Tropicimonas sp. IMCC6043]|uniref:isocitrate/isopropylmalate dehydrogenase family protein n=1 Tax=Tropicimonas sp. IMCC6043 TaxID=2510645 RepID=UPI00101BF3C7|nr:isocitrate/isopropylmalate family dehydrogenase [Tropicimonas sp. IMCC6043]RYH11271.1 isocitrate/isopropylmalate dehydrogenase family protein [Tropicimonas sp. IMCC6043]
MTARDQLRGGPRQATTGARIALIKGDGIGVDVSEAAMLVAEAACRQAGAPALDFDEIRAGAGYFRETGRDIEPGGEVRAGNADAIFLGAIGLPEIRHPDGTEISPHLRLRDRYGLYAGIRPVKAYPNAPQRLADPRAAKIDLVILRESTEGLFYSAAAHGRAQVIGDEEVRETLRITRATTERLHRFAFRLAGKRLAQGKRARLTCVDKANVFTSMAFFRKIFGEVAAEHPDAEIGYNYVDAQALDLVRRPWDFDILVMENMFGDILSDLAGGLVGGMGMAACGEIGDETGLFQPAHGSAPDIMGRDEANPLAAILSAALMLDYLAEKTGIAAYAAAGGAIDMAVEAGFAARQLRPMEFGGDMGTRAVTDAVLTRIETPEQSLAAG